MPTLAEHQIELRIFIEILMRQKRSNFFSTDTKKMCLATISTGLQYYAAARNLVVNALLARLFFSFARNQSEKDWTYLLYYAEKKHC